MVHDSCVTFRFDFYGCLSPNPNIVKNATSAHANMIAIYELSYKKGKVIGLGIYSDVVINNRYFLVFLDHLLQAGQPK
jgi:hypothetical protein